MNADQEESVVPKKSKGQLYKEIHGHSKTFKKNMLKRGLNPHNADQVAGYKTERRMNKKAIRKIQVEKTFKSLSSEERRKEVTINHTRATGSQKWLPVF